jgi:hypothetical protein
VFTITDTVGRAFGITDAKKLAKVPLVMVRWTDYSPVHASWEPLENMSQAVVQDHVQPLQGRLDVEAGTIMQELEVELVADIILMCRRLASRPSLSGTAFIPVPQQVYAVGIWRRVCWAHRCGARDVCKSQSGGAVPVEVTAKFSTLSAFWAVVLPGSTPSGAVYEDTVSRCSLLLAPHGQVLRNVRNIQRGERCFILKREGGRFAIFVAARNRGVVDVPASAVSITTPLTLRHRRRTCGGAGNLLHITCKRMTLAKAQLDAVLAVL